MNQEIVAVTKTEINGENVNSVNARDIHKYLQVKTKFADWVKRAIEKYGFEENKDFVVLKSGNGTNAFIDYIVTMDMSKELCMIENNPKGKETRKYFIEKEKEVKQVATRHYQIPETFAEALRLAADLSDENIKLNQTIKAKDEVILAVADLNIKAGEVSIGDFSKNLAIEELGRNNLFAWLKARGFLMMNTEPYQQYVERGYFVRKPSDKRINGEVKYTTMLTPKGTVWLTKILRAEYNLDEAKSA